MPWAPFNTDLSSDNARGIDLGCGSFRYRISGAFGLQGDSRTPYYMEAAVRERRPLAERAEAAERAELNARAEHAERLAFAARAQHHAQPQLQMAQRFHDAFGARPEVHPQQRAEPSEMTHNNKVLCPPGPDYYIPTRRTTASSTCSGKQTAIDNTFDGTRALGGRPAP